MFLINPQGSEISGEYSGNTENLFRCSAVQEKIIKISQFKIIYFMGISNRITKTYMGAGAISD